MKKIAAFLWFLAFSWGASGCILVYSNFNFLQEPKPMKEHLLEGSGRDRILLIDISGEILNEAEAGLLGFSLRESQVSLLHEQLALAEKNANKIRAVLVRINSPGGSVTASDLLYLQLKRFKERSQIPVYAMMMDVAASGGYYVAMAADQVYASPTTVTGSIGVIMLNLSFEGLMKKIGVSSKVIKSGEYKDVGSPLKDFTPEERRILQSVIDDLFERFVEVVEDGRPNLSREALLKAADGRIYTAQQARDLGLIDGVMYLPELIELIKHQQRLEKARVVMYKRPTNIASNIYSQAYAPLPRGLNLIDPKLTQSLSRGMNLPGFYYLWEPGVF